MGFTVSIFLCPSGSKRLNLSKSLGLIFIPPQRVLDIRWFIKLGDRMHTNFNHLKGTKSTRCLKKKYTKLVKRNLKLIRLINNMLPFSNFTQSNLNFEPSFVRICQVLTEIWPFLNEFENENFGQLRIFGSVKFANKLLIKYPHFCLHFQHKSKREGRNNEF